MAVAWTLVVLGILLAVIAVIAGYIRYQALDNETFANTSEELIADPVIRDQIATTLVEQLYGNVDVEAELERRLPPTSKGSPGHWPRRPASSVTARHTGSSSDHARKSFG